ncbi:AAA family ATPase [soil metagenome]
MGIEADSVAPGAIAPVRLSLLGAPVVEVDGAPIEVDTRKAIALLVFLAMTRHERRRDTLATLLWPDYDGAHARAALRRTLSALNKALHGKGLAINRATVGVDNDLLALDVDDFRESLAGCPAHERHPSRTCASCSERLAHGVSLYRDDFLAGFSLRDSPDFDDWMGVEAEGLRRELSLALARLVAASAAGGDLEAAIRYARRRLALDPLHEPAHQELMSLYAAAGRRSDALRQYRDCVAVLDGELGVAPLEETTRLYAAVRDARVDRVEPQAPEIDAPRNRVVPIAPPELPLVGRAADSEALANAYEAVAPDGRFIAVQGEAGIGKTRLVEDFLAGLGARGAITVSARCNEDEGGLAFGVVAEALAAAVARAPDGWAAEVPSGLLSEASRLLPELCEVGAGVPSPPPLDGPGARRRFLEGISAVLSAALGGSRAGAIFFDDLHWVDDSSLEALTYLVGRLRGRPLLVIGAWRAEQVQGNDHLRRLVSVSRRTGLGSVVRPARLSEVEVLELVESATSEGGGELGTRLLQETEGLPLFIVEYLTALGEQSGEQWVVPEGIRELLRARLSTLSETGRQLLSAAAVIGRSFDFETVRGASGRSEEESVAAVEELTARGFIEEIAPLPDAVPAYDFSHAKVRAVTLEECSLARRRLLHRRVAEALMRRKDLRGESASVAGVIANHLRAAGSEVQAAHYVVVAGEHARTLGANREALEHFRTALALGHPEVAHLDEVVGDLLTLMGDYEAALDSLEAAAARCQADQLGSIEHKIGGVHHRRGDWEAAASHFTAALAALEGHDDDGRRARVIADRSLNAHRRGLGQEARRLAHEALELAVAAADVEALAQTRNILGVLAKSRGDLDEARDHLARSLTLAETLSDPSARIAALNNLALTVGAQSRVHEALAYVDTALRLCVLQGDRHREAALHNNKADLLHAAGDTSRAMSHLKQAVGIFAEIGEPDDMQPEIWKLFEW